MELSTWACTRALSVDGVTCSRARFPHVNPSRRSEQTAFLPLLRGRKGRRLIAADPPEAFRRLGPAAGVGLLKEAPLPGQRGQAAAGHSGELTEALHLSAGLATTNTSCGRADKNLIFGGKGGAGRCRRPPEALSPSRANARLREVAPRFWESLEGKNAVPRAHAVVFRKARQSAYLADRVRGPVSSIGINHTGHNTKTSSASRHVPAASGVSICCG